MSLYSSLENRLKCTIKRIPSVNTLIRDQLPDCDTSVDITFKIRHGDDLAEIEREIAARTDDICSRLSVKAGQIPPGTEKEGKRRILGKHEEEAILKRAEKLCDDPLGRNLIRDFSLNLRPGDLLAVCHDEELLLDKLVNLAKTKLGSSRSPFLGNMFNIRGQYDGNLPEFRDDKVLEDPLLILKHQLNSTTLSAPELINALYLEDEYELVETSFSIDETDKTLSIQGAENGDTCVILLDKGPDYTETSQRFRSYPLIFTPGLEHFDQKYCDASLSCLGVEPLLTNTLTNRRKYVGGNASTDGGYTIVESLYGKTFDSMFSGTALKVFKVVKKIRA